MNLTRKEVYELTEDEFVIEVMKMKYILDAENNSAKNNSTNHSF